jgi:Ion channel
MASCVAIHAAGVTWLLGHLRRTVSPRTNFWRFAGTCIRVANWMIVCHLIEITAWAALYVWATAMPDASSAWYFSAVTYTTTGYGDLVLPENWRLAGAVEALTGILMCGWSAAFFFAVLNRINATRGDDLPAD